MDQSYPTASLTDTSPLLFLLGCWGVYIAARQRAVRHARLTWFVLVGAAAGASGVLLWGYISQRYLGDLVPFFVIAAGIGLVDLCRRLEPRSRAMKAGAVGAFAAVGIYCIAVNLAIADFPAGQWTMAQDARFVSAEKSWSLGSLADTVRRGEALPYWAPAGQLFAMNDCSGLYLSTGSDMKNVPGQQIEHYTWKPVEQSSAFTHVFDITFNRPPTDLTHPVTILHYGKSHLVLEPAGGGLIRLRLLGSGTAVNWPPAAGYPFSVPFLHAAFRMVATVDPNLGSFKVGWSSTAVMINHFVAGRGPAIVDSTAVPPGASPPAVTVTNVPTTTKTHSTLCRSLTHSART
jgi:hypothetical protein